MNKPNLLKTNHQLLGLSAFATLGTGALLSVNSAFLVLLLISGLTLFSELVTNYRIRKQRHDSTISSFLTFKYTNDFLAWSEKYIEQSDNLTEKKYKALFCFIWVSHHSSLMFSHHPIEKTHFAQLAKNLIEHKNTHYDILKAYHDRDINYLHFLKEHPDDLVIAQKIFQDFELEGLAGKSFQSWHSGALSFLLLIQEYRLRANDIKAIESSLKRLPLYHHIHVLDDLHSSLYSILTHTEQQFLPILKKYFEAQPEHHDKESYLELINTMMLKKDLDSKLPKLQGIKTKLKKI